jgi:outer membrane immunogenic protein
MLRKLLLSSVAVTAMVGSALAADLPRREPPPAYVPPAPVFTWTGFYLGVNAGGAFRVRNHFDDNFFFPGVTPTPLFLLANNNNNGNNARFIGGGQAGVNWQINQFVLGIEADGQALVGNNNNNGNNFFNFGNNGDNTRFLGTVRARGGIAFDRFLVYGTGGFAYGTGPTINNFNPLLVGASPFFNNNNDNGNNWLFGYAVGGGVEWAFLDNWSIKAEYLYTDIRRTDNNNFFFNNFNHNNDLFRERNHIVRAGLNYRFNWGFGYGAPAPVMPVAPAPMVRKY